MQRFTTTLALSALLTTVALAEDDKTLSKRSGVQVEQTDMQQGTGLEHVDPPIIIDGWRDLGFGPTWNGQSQSLDGYQAAGAGSRLFIDHGYSFEVEETDMQSAAGVESPKVDLPTDPTPKTKWEELDGDFNAAGADLVRAAENGAAPNLEPFDDAVAKWSFELGSRTSFHDLSEYVPPVLEVRRARDLWARAIDASVLGRLDAARAAAARGQLTLRHFDEVRVLLARRAEVLDDPVARRGLERLERRLADAVGMASPDEIDLVPFDLEFTKQRMQQAVGMMNARRGLDGEVQFSDRWRITELAGRLKQQIKPGKKGLSVYPVR